MEGNGQTQLRAQGPRFLRPIAAPRNGRWLRQLVRWGELDVYTPRRRLCRLVALPGPDQWRRQLLRFSVRRVELERRGIFRSFNSGHAPQCRRRQRADVRLASGALPPGFPAVEIEGEHYWDGGLVSNTPLGWMVEAGPPKDTLVFQVDLWSARGPFPRNMARVSTRQKEIQFSSRTRAESNRFKELQRFKNAVAELLAKLPPDLAGSPEVAPLRSLSERKVGNLIQLIYRSKDYEGDSKDYEFSRRSMEEHWHAGYHDTVRTLRHPEVLQRPASPDGVFIFDVHEHGRE